MPKGRPEGVYKRMTKPAIGRLLNKHIERRNKLTKRINRLKKTGRPTTEWEKERTRLYKTIRRVKYRFERME